MAAEDLLTVDEAKRALNVKGENEEPQIAALITDVSRLMERMTDRVLKQRAMAVRLLGPQGPKLYVRASPIATTPTPTVKVAGQTQTVWTGETDGDPVTFDVLIASDSEDEVSGLRNHLWRRTSWMYGGPAWAWKDMPPQIVLTYTGGFAIVPDDLKRAAKYLLQKQWRDLQNQSAGFRLASSPIGGEIVPVNEPSIPYEARMVIDHYRKASV